MDKQDKKILGWRYWVPKTLMLIVCIVIAWFIFFHETPIEGYKLDDWQCTKSSISNLNNCTDIGYESVGFLTSEHFYLCNEIKIPYNCIEGDYQNKTLMNISIADVLRYYPKFELRKQNGERRE